MSLNLSVALIVSLPDGQNVIMVGQSDTSIAPPGSNDVDQVDVAIAQLDQMLSSISQRGRERLTELKEHL